MTKGQKANVSKEPYYKAVRINQITKDATLQVRRKLDEGTIARYVDLIRAGTKMPPVSLAAVDGMLILVDGWHRLAAYQRLGREEVFVQIKEANIQEATWMAAEANTAHGLPLKRSEYRNVFRAYVKAGKHRKGKGYKSYREMQKDLGKGHTTIRAWMLKDFPRIAARIGGEEFALSSGGLRDLEPGEFNEALNHLGLLQQAFLASTDPEVRGRVIAEVRQALEDMEASGNWTPPVAPEF